MFFCTRVVAFTIAFVNMPLVVLVVLVALVVLVVLIVLVVVVLEALLRLQL